MLSVFFRRFLAVFCLSYLCCEFVILICRFWFSAGNLRILLWFQHVFFLFFVQLELVFVWFLFLMAVLDWSISSIAHGSSLSKIFFFFFFYGYTLLLFYRPTNGIFVVFFSISFSEVGDLDFVIDRLLLSYFLLRLYFF